MGWTSLQIEVKTSTTNMIICMKTHYKRQKLTQPPGFLSYYCIFVKFNTNTFIKPHLIRFWKSFVKHAYLKYPLCFKNPLVICFMVLTSVYKILLQASLLTLTMNFLMLNVNYVMLFIPNRPIVMMNKKPDWYYIVLHSLFPWNYVAKVYSHYFSFTHSISIMNIRFGFLLL